MLCTVPAFPRLYIYGASAVHLAGEGATAARIGFPIYTQGGQFGTCDLTHPGAYIVKIIQGVTFRDEVVGLDGNHFKDCIFTNCGLEYGGGDVVLERTSILGCKHMLYGSARQTAEYMRVVGLCDDTSDKWTEYTGIVH